MTSGAEAEIVPLRRPQKSEAAFRTISEVSEDLDVPQHVLRFWESRFTLIRPLKRGGGRRYYRPEDVQLLRRIRDLLYRDGYTIRGVQKLLREQAKGTGETAGEAPAPTVVSATPALAPAPVAHVVPAAAPAQPVPVAQPAPPHPASRAETPPSAGLSSARRAVLEGLLREIEELKAQLAAARK